MGKRRRYYVDDVTTKSKFARVEDDCGKERKEAVIAAETKVEAGAKVLVGVDAGHILDTMVRRNYHLHRSCLYCIIGGG